MIVAEPAIIKDAAWWTEWHLWNWSNWMFGDELPDRAETSDCLQNFTTYDSNSERAYTALDAWAAETTNAVIVGLGPSEGAAIHNAYGIAVFRFWRANVDELLIRAKANVQAGLRRRGVWLGE